ncbi:MAG: adenylate/guanylate cyclase domain-containing protein [Labilithrix sp.]
MEPVTLTRGVRCKASRQAVWEHVSDTLRLNRAISNSTLDVKKRETTGLERFELRGRIGGIPVTYVEQPFSWTVGEYFSFYRVFVGGPARSVATRYDLSDVPDGPGCDVTVRIDVMPASAIFRPLVWFATRRSIEGLASYIASVDDDERKTVVSRLDRDALATAVKRVGTKFPPELVSRLADHLAAADDFDLAPIRPFALAGVWGVDRFQLLRLCLESVPAGLLELRWGLMCPSCQTAASTIASLRELDGGAHCHACDLRYDTDLDRAVEAQFSPHPSVRAVDFRPYCIGGPALTPHVLAQVPVDVDAEGTLEAPETEGRTRLFVRGGAIASVEVVRDAPESVRFRIGAKDVTPAQVSVAPGGAIHVENRSGEGRHVKLERTSVTTDAATAHHVATMPEFRPLFGAEALRPGLALRVAHVAILFSDLCGSTALYSRVGDAEAFGLVTDCLTFGTEIVERRGGTVVKTIGDAVMAAFCDSRAAVAAAVEMLTRWSAFASEHPTAKSLDLKIGVYDGACTIVTANGAVDYFGQTVNRAARVQHLAGPREVVIAADLVEVLPEGAPVDAGETFEATVKGIDEPLRLKRIRPRTT